MRDAARFPIIISASDKGNSHSCRGLNCRRDDTQTSSDEVVRALWTASGRDI